MSFHGIMTAIKRMEWRSIIVKVTTFAVSRYAISTPSVIKSAWSHVKATCVCPCGGGEGELIEEDTPADKETREPRHVV